MVFLLDNFNLGDLMYGLQSEREKVTACLNEKYPDNYGMWTIDQVNKKIIQRTIYDKRLMLDDIKDLKCLQNFASKFFDYLCEQQDTQAFKDIMLKTESSEDEDCYLTQYNCQQAIKYIVSENNTQNTKIHFILDGIDICEALKELTEPRSSFTSAEIREIARNIENPRLGANILFYRNNQKLDFSIVQQEFLRAISVLKITTEILKDSPIKEIKQKINTGGELERSGNPVLSRLSRLSRRRQLVFSSELSVEPVPELDKFSVKLNGWLLDSENSRDSLLELFAICKDIKDLEKCIVNKESIQNSLMSVLRQFSEKAAILKYEITKTGPENFRSLDECKDVALSQYSTPETFARYVTEQLNIGAFDYLKPIKDFCGVGEIPAEKIIEESCLKEFLSDLNKLFKHIYCAPNAPTGIFVASKSPFSPRKNKATKLASSLFADDRFRSNVFAM